MINVHSTKTLEEFKDAVFRNFREAADQLNAERSPSVAPGVADDSVGSGTSSTPSTDNLFDVIYIGDYDTKIYMSGGDLTFEDANAGAITLSQIATLISILWTSGSAYGIKAANAAGTVKYFGANSTADGWNMYDDPANAE